MSKRRKFLERVRRNRQRLRDVAAAEATVAEVDRRRELDRLDATIDLMMGTVDAAPTTLEGARSAADLLTTADELSALRMAVLTQTQKYEVSKSAAAGATERLRQRERELRSTEESIERIDQRRAREDARREQAATDDIVATRWSKSA